MPVYPEPIDGVGGSLADGARIALDHQRRLLEELEELLFTKGRVPSALASQVKGRQEAQVQSRQLELGRA